MRRISDEDGAPAGSRNFGRLALFSIPLMLGIAASVWLGVWIQAHYFLIDRSQERRRGSLVAAPDPQRTELTIKTYVGDNSIAVDNVDLQGGHMTVKFHNFSGHDVTNLQIKWRWVAPDGTILSDAWDWSHEIGGPGGLSKGEKGILTEPHATPDPRASGIEVWVIGTSR